MDITHGVGHHRFGNLAIDLREWRGRMRQERIETASDISGHLPPNGTVADVAQIIDRIIHYPVRDSSRIRPVVGVECFFLTFACLVLHRRSLRLERTGNLASNATARAPRRSCPPR